MCDLVRDVYHQKHNIFPFNPWQQLVCDYIRVCSLAGLFVCSYVCVVDDDDDDQNNNYVNNLDNDSFNDDHQC